MDYFTRDEALAILISAGILNDNFSIKEIDNGIVHDVVYIKDKDKDFYLKIRLDHFKTNPAIKIDPLDIFYEYRALLLIREKCGPVVPEVFFFKSNFMLLENMKKPPEKILYDIMPSQEISLNDITKFAKNIRQIHSALMEAGEEIRLEKSNNQRYKDYLYWRFGAWNNNSLNSLIKNLEMNGTKQLILGDLNPKNIVLGETIKYFDFETFHFGDREFDLGFFLGHLLLNYFNELEKCDNLVKGFKQEYPLSAKQEKLIVNVCLGTIYYRMKTNFDYTTCFAIDKQKMADKIDHLFKKNLSNFNELFFLLRDQ